MISNKRGDPNGSGVPKWPVFSDANPVVMVLSQPPHTGPVPSEEGLKGLDAYFAWRRTPEGEAAVRQEAPASAATPQMGIAAKKPVFGGACKICPWSAMAEVVQVAMKPYGYDVQICYNCNAADAPRIVSEARLPPPYKPDPAVPEILAPRNVPGLGAIDFGAVLQRTRLHEVVLQLTGPAALRRRLQVETCPLEKPHRRLILE
jgi:hypothetical protein